VSRLTRILGRHAWTIATALVAIAVSVAGALTGLVGPALAASAAIAIGALAIVRVERERRAREARRRTALIRLRECAGALMKRVAAYGGKPDRPQEWGPGPPMNLEDLARTIRENGAVYYTIKEAATLEAWARGARAAASDFSSCALAHVADLDPPDRDVIARAQAAAAAAVSRLDTMTSLWRGIDELRRLNRESMRGGAGAPFVETIGERQTQSGVEQRELGKAFEQLNEALLEIAKRAN
jgi:hypothetical protein